MIVVLDTTALQADPGFRKRFWRLMGLRPDGWNLRIVVPWTVTQELLANRRRSIAEVREHLQKAIDDVDRKLGLLVSNPRALRQLDQALETIDAIVTDILDRYRVEIASVPEISHEELVTRATQRTKPCNAKGDGYRDTLNWLTVLELAAKNPAQAILWVSNNSNDFADTMAGDSSARSLHPHLLNDLAQHAPQSQVSYCLDLDEALDRVVEEYQVAVKTADEQVWETQVQRVTELVLSQIRALPASERTLDPVECGLPLRLFTAYGLLEKAAASEPASVTNLAGATELPFTIRFTGTVRMIHRSPADGSASVGQSTDNSTEMVTKLLVAVGTANLDPVRHIISNVVVDSITAVDGDPVVIKNRATATSYSESVRALSRLVFGGVAEGLGGSAYTHTMGPIFEQLRAAGMLGTPLSDLGKDAGIGGVARSISKQLRAAGSLGTPLSDLGKDAGIGGVAGSISEHLKGLGWKPPSVEPKSEPDEDDVSPEE